MAQINNGKEGAGFLAVNIDVLHKEPEEGFITRNNVGMNSDLGLLWTRISYEVGENEIYSQEVLLHSLSLIEWPRQIQAMLAGKGCIQRETPYGFERSIHFDICSPELLITLRQFCRQPEKRPGGSRSKRNSAHYRYELMVTVDTVIASGDTEMRGEGPSMFLQPNIDAVLQFAHDLRSEAELALLLDEVLSDDSDPRD